MESKQELNAELLARAHNIVKESTECVRTPLLKNVESLGFIDAPEGVEVHLKLENMQTTGSFKSRGLASQMAFASEEILSGRKPLVTMSAGNYGKAFATACRNRGLKGNVIMPVTVPDSRQKLIESMGCNVIRVPTTELASTVDKMVSEGMTYLHSFDDVNIMAGYGSVAEEITDEVAPDIVLVCCGGGGLVTGIATSLKLRGFEKCRIYGVEPETANTMQLSFETGKAASLPTVRSIAAGLAPPFAGTLCYKYASQYVEGIITLSDAEIANATKGLYQRGILAEPSGAAAFGALKFGKVPELGGTVVVVVTGSNVTPSEMATLFEQFAL